MSDFLVRLYDLPDSGAASRVLTNGIAIRRALPPERHLVLGWIGAHFAEPWVSEAALGLSQMPPTVFLAVRENRLLGFACYDTTARGFFGPTGVAPDCRGEGIGETLLFATLRAMREAGYAYAVIGDPGPVEFYTSRLDAVEIPGSRPGHYAGMLSGRTRPNDNPKK